jgi:hypothetical protein
MSNPAQFTFRLRFNFSKTFRLNSEAEELPLLSTAAGEQIKVKSGLPAVPLKEAERVAVIGGPYQTESDARIAGVRAKNAVLLWALEQRVGIDFGDGMPLGLATDEGLRALASEHGVPVRNDVHGVDVYPAGGKTKFVHVSVDAVAGKHVPRFIEAFQRDFMTAAVIGQRLVVAAELYFGSWFDVVPRARFVTLMTAIEAMLDPAPRGKAVQTLVSELIRATRQSSIPQQTKDSICGALQWLKSESIGQAGRRLASTLLPDDTFAGLSAGSFFRHAYDIRSKIVHNGYANPALLFQLVNTMEEFVAKLLRASVNTPDLAAGSLRRASLRQRLRAAWWAFKYA